MRPYDTMRPQKKKKKLKNNKKNWAWKTCEHMQWAEGSDAGCCHSRAREIDPTRIEERKNKGGEPNVCALLSELAGRRAGLNQVMKKGGGGPPGKKVNASPDAQSPLRGGMHRSWGAHSSGKEKGHLC